MKSFAIVGAGAVGCYYGARLAQAGHDVRFLLRSDFGQISQNGISVRSIHGDFDLPDVNCFQHSSEMGCVDVVIVAWKATSNAHYQSVIEPLMHDETVILTLQNGLGNVEQLGEIFGNTRVLGGLCFVCINRLAPGEIHHSGGGPIAMGESVLGVTDRLKHLSDLFKGARIECEIARNLGEAQWRKLVWNIPFNGLCITEGGIDTKALLASPEGEKKVRALMKEVIGAANHLGFIIEDDYAEVQLNRTYPMGPYRPSSMIDYVEKREVEVEAIWGEPLRRAQQGGVPVTLLQRLYEQIVQLT